MIKLTQREAQVLQGISIGCKTREIAHELNLSQHTVDTYRKILFHKLNAINAPALVRKGFELGLLQPGS